jgi:hypothetical protein
MLVSGRPAPDRKGAIGWLAFDSGSRRRTANPPTRRRCKRQCLKWNEGDCIYLGRRTLRVIGRRDDDADQPPVLVVEEVA